MRKPWQLVHHLPARKKFGLLIAAVNTTLVIFVAIIFIFSTYILGRNQIRNALSAEARQLVSQHLIFGEDRILYSLEDNGMSIEADLLSDGASAIIYNAKLEPIGRFGLFELNDAMFEENSESDYGTKIREVLKTGKPQYYSEKELIEASQFESLLYPIIKDGKSVGVIAIFMPLVFFQRLLSITFSIFLIVIPISAIINYFLGQYIANIAFKPLKKLIDGMNTITVESILSKVKPEGNREDEAYQLARKYNDMLDRVHEGIIKQREFIANASHELKSPIARAVSRLDVLSLMMKHNDTKNSLSSIDGLREDLVGLAAVIENMLVLARVSEKPQRYTTFTPKNVFEKLSSVYGDSHIDIEVVSAKKVFFAKEAFETLFKNLLENAVKHGTGNPVTIRAEYQKKSCSFSVTNYVAPNTQIDTRQLLKRHYSSAKEKGKGFGIGLSIVKSIVEDYGLTISFVHKENLFTVTVEGFGYGDV